VRIIVTGSRYWMSPDAVYMAISDEIAQAPFREQITIIHGGCPTGADSAAAAWVWSADEVRQEIFHADWEKYGKRAGPIRNAEMVKAGADVVLAFPLPGGRGTQHTIRLAREAGIPVKVWGEDE
jgi:hypothetical protein